MGKALERRKRITRHFHDLLMLKLDGKISQPELERRTAQQHLEEQLQLGIGASTEVRRAS